MALWVGGVGLVVLLLSAGGVSAGSSHVAVDKFCTDASLAGLRWDGITHLSQAYAPLSVDATGAVAPADAAAWAQWSAPLVAAAHGNGSKIVLPLHIASKPIAAQIFAPPFNATLLTAAARAAAALAAAHSYDGVQLDIEGLHQASAAGYEFFARAVKSALSALSAGRTAAYTLSVTVYMPKLEVSDFGTYNLTRLTTDPGLCDFVFLMGYDMGWAEAAGTGAGAHEAGPNAPLDGLALGLKNALAAGAAPGAMILALPMYGKMFTCDGSAAPTQGNCSTAEKNMQNKKVDDLAAAAAAAPPGDCTVGVDGATASVVLDCAQGVAIPGAGPPIGQRQQAWFESSATIAAKVGLAAAHGLGGIGFWTGCGMDARASAEGKATWDEVAAYVAQR